MKGLPKKFNIRVGGGGKSAVDASPAPTEHGGDDGADMTPSRCIKSTRDSLQLMGHPDLQQRDSIKSNGTIEYPEDGGGGDNKNDHNKHNGSKSNKKTRAKSRRDSLNVLRGPTTILRGHAHKQQMDRVKEKEGYRKTTTPGPMDASRTSTSTCSTANTDASYRDSLTPKEMASLYAPSDEDEDEVRDDDDFDVDVCVDFDCGKSNVDVDGAAEKNSSPRKSCLTVKSMRESLQSCRSSGNECAKSDAAATAEEAASRDESSIVVGFLTVEFREYPPELGDNPACHGGPPLTVGWEYDRRTVELLPLEEYERVRPPRREAADLHLPNHVRVQRLKRAGFAKAEIAACVRRTNRDRDRRYWTTSHLKFSRVHEAGESAGRMLQRLVHMRQKDEDMMEKLWRAPGSSSSSGEELGTENDDQASVASEEQ